MVDNKGISPIPSFSFKQGDASGMANKMSEEKYGQGTEYFSTEMEEEQPQKQEFFQDRSAQLRASLDSLAMANAGSIMFVKSLKKKNEALKKINKKEDNNKQHDTKDENEELIFDE